MLDLSLTMKNNYEVKWIDGTVLILPPPAQKLYKTISSFIKDDSFMEQIDKIYDLCNTILNTNTQKIEIDASLLTIEACVIFLGDYLGFYNEQINSVVFQVTPQTQAATA